MVETPILWATRGLPGSGKTTWANGLSLPVVGRDRIRRWLHPAGDFPHGVPGHEALVTVAHTSQLIALLAAGRSVVCDDTNLHPDHLRVLQEVAELTGAALWLHDLTDVPLQVCIARDAARPHPVGAEVIRRMHTTMLAAQAHQPIDVAGEVTE